MGGLEKWWLDEEGIPTGEVYPFRAYEDETAFRDDVTRLIAEAQEKAVEENLDEFLAIIDRVKEHAVEAGHDDEAIFEVEGLFELGHEDAYLRRPFDGDNRLHDHVERSVDECWRIHARRVVDPAGVPLGWAVFVVHYPDLASSAPPAEVDHATRARILDLDHWRDELDARLAAQYMIGLMLEGGRVEDPTFAFMNDTEVFECASVQCSVEKVLMPEWEELKAMR
jgi:hypothetical protein